MAKSTNRDNYVLKTFNGLAYGFFISFVLGTILKQVGYAIHYQALVSWGQIACYLMGPCIGVAIAYTLDLKGLSLLSSMIAGAIGAGTLTVGKSVSVHVGNPIMAYFAVVIAVVIANMIEDKTPFDIFLVPLICFFCAGFFAKFVGPYVNQFLHFVGHYINQGAQMQPILVGMVIALIMGMLTTTPFTSMVLGMMLGLKGIAAGAALAGCCAQMVGLAMMSIDDNDFGDVLAIGIGTSMFQFKNILKRPLIWLPPMIASLISGMISAGLLGIKCTTLGSWIGTTGLVGLFECIKVMGNNYWLPLIIVDILLPMGICFGMYKAFRKLNYIKSGDLKINKL